MTSSTTVTWLTVHKSQGSQWDDVVLFDESFAFQDSRARWLYTGITRSGEAAERGGVGRFAHSGLILRSAHLRARLEGWLHPGLMVRDGASAPPHHEGWLFLRHEVKILPVRAASRR